MYWWAGCTGEGGSAIDHKQEGRSLTPNQNLKGISSLFHLIFLKIIMVSYHEALVLYALQVCLCCYVSQG